MVEKKKVSEMSSEEIKDAVKESYSRVAQSSGGGCCGSAEPKSDSTNEDDKS